ncbi:Macrolide export ATP-binding/permease protein MacB [Sodalis praecaptivus]
MSVMHLPQMAIETRHLSKRFGEVIALEDINLHIARGEFVAIMGASGSGKTTLMNILTCLDTASEGQVLLKGTDAAGLDEEGRRRFRAQKSAWCFSSFI